MRLGVKLNTGDEMNHNELFDDLQEKYYKTNDKKILEEMYVLLLEFYRNYITDYARKRGLKFTKALGRIGSLSS